MILWDTYVFYHFNHINNISWNDKSLDYLNAISEKILNSLCDDKKTNLCNSTTGDGF